MAGFVDDHLLLGPCHLIRRVGVWNASCSICTVVVVDNTGRESVHIDRDSIVTAILSSLNIQMQESNDSGGVAGFPADESRRRGEVLISIIGDGILHHCKILVLCRLICFKTSVSVVSVNRIVLESDLQYGDIQRSKSGEQSLMKNSHIIVLQKDRNFRWQLRIA